MKPFAEYVQRESTQKIQFFLMKEKFRGMEMFIHEGKKITEAAGIRAL